MRNACLRSAAARRASMFLLVTAALAATGGCAGRFSTHTDYLAPGFTRESLRGRTVVVVSPATAAGAAGLYRGELAGVAAGLREAGARVEFAAAPPAGRVGDVQGAAVNDASETGSGATGGDACSLAPIDPAVSAVQPMDEAALPVGDRAAYYMLVDFTDAAIYRAYAAPHDRGGDGRAAAASRTSGRRVGLRFALVRGSDRTAQWVAGGKGELWRTRTAAAPGAAPAALTVDDDLGAGNLPLYPPPPRPQAVSSRLVRRLLAVLPSPPALQPN